MADIDSIENKLSELTKNVSKEEFIYEFLLLFQTPKSTITKMRKGDRLVAAKGYENIVIVKRKMFFVPLAENEDVFKNIEFFKTAPFTHSHKPRFVVVTNFVDFYAMDTKYPEQGYLKIKFEDLHKHYEFFNPLLGKERYRANQENPADVKAAERMAKVYDEIIKNNRELAREHTHDLNVFLTRLLFCFFAADTGVFEGENLFTKSVFEHTKEDGSDLAEYLGTLFAALDDRDKKKYPAHIQAFPYVNGRLFGDRFLMPTFTAKIRQLIIDCGHELCWADINPDIFGSMFQAVSLAEVRASLGQHYTSVPNIMKVIRPLFLDELYEEFEKAKFSTKALQKLLNRMAEIKIFDPACGSGNFLIIAYKQMRLLEIEIIKQMSEIEKGFAFNYSHILLRNFYGIEIDDFACEIARLSLYLAQHQMNRKVMEELGVVQATLPLAESGNIACGNATRVDWDEVCPRIKAPRNLQSAIEQSEIQNSPLKLEVPQEYNEIYVLGNPPYLGSKLQEDKHKADLARLLPGNKNLDYISCWFYKGAEYVSGMDSIVLAFVTTNSLCQGEQVANLWPKLIKFNAEIGFAYRSFKWTNSAKYNAGVTCAIISLRSKSAKPKFIYEGSRRETVKNINFYLADSSDVFVARTGVAISDFPPIVFGSMPRDGGWLILDISECKNITNKHPDSKKFIKKYIGSEEFINGKLRYCIWIESSDVVDAIKISFLADRFKKVAEMRNSSDAPSTRAYAQHPYMFVQRAYKPTHSIIVPRVSSERREYIPIGFLDKDTVISDSAMAIYDAELWVFAVVTSRMHMTWVRAVGGRLKTDYRYSAELCYNTFPFPEISAQKKKELEYHAKQVLAERAKHSELTMADLYDPDKMPEGLRKAHNSLDIAIEQCYRKRPFDSDEKRLEYLFKMYEKMVAGKKLDAEQLELL